MKQTQPVLTTVQTIFWTNNLCVMLCSNLQLLLKCNNDFRPLDNIIYMSSSKADWHTERRVWEPARCWQCPPCCIHYVFCYFSFIPHFLYTLVLFQTLHLLPFSVSLLWELLTPPWLVEPVPHYPVLPGVFSVFPSLNASSSLYLVSSIQPHFTF